VAMCWFQEALFKTNSFSRVVKFVANGVISWMSGFVDHAFFLF
jgi:hypothetical protein